MARTESDLLRISLDLLILKALTWGPMHGFAIGEWIDAATGSLLLVEEGTLYPALHRLERRRWISAEWGVSDSNRGRRPDRHRTDSRPKPSVPCHKANSYRYR